MSDPAMLGAGRFQRVEGDRYWTPAWCTHALIEAVHIRDRIWEPACGRGDMVVVWRGVGADVSASDIAGDTLGCRDAETRDFLTAVGTPEPPFSIVTNPPYRDAEAFIRRALYLTRVCGSQVAMLLRNEYDCASSRRDLFERPPFAQKIVLTKRPRWDDGLGQHSASPRHNFAWYVWDWQHTGPATMRWAP